MTALADTYGPCRLNIAIRSEMHISPTLLGLHPQVPFLRRAQAAKVRSADATPLTQFVEGVDALYATTPRLDANGQQCCCFRTLQRRLSRNPRSGFIPGAKLKRSSERIRCKRRVDFNQASDARILCKDRMYLRELSSICLAHCGLRSITSGLRGLTRRQSASRMNSE